MTVHTQSGDTTSASGSITLEPIGRVRNGISERPDTGWSEVVSRLELLPEFADGLDGVEDFSHLMVLFWLHGMGPEQRRKLRVRPKGRADLPEVGVFAVHSPARPNPIGVTVVELLHREGDTLVVRGLDALDGTPILDIKAYGLAQARLAEKDLRIPEWARRLHG